LGCAHVQAGSTGEVELIATTEGNGAGKPRAKTSTERSRDFRRRQREKAEQAEREATLQQNRDITADVAEPVASNSDDVAELMEAETATNEAAPAAVASSAGNAVAPLVGYHDWRAVPPIRPAKTDWLTLAAVFALATVTAGFSIYGLTSIFVGAFWPVIGMGAVLECAKLRAIALIEMGRGARWVRFGLIVLVTGLMGLNAIGAFGFLAKAHIGHVVESSCRCRQAGRPRC
jgi:hypothetical protein